MSWLPPEYKVPEGASQFMKFVKGTNQFRVLSEPVIGFEVWEDSAEGRKPHRFKSFQEAVNSPFSDKIKHFWAFAVWNYESENVQVLQITQKTIMRAIEALNIDEDWGSPLEYDLVVKKTGDGMETEYTVQPKPKKPVTKEITEAVKASNLDLQTLFVGDYPMSAQTNENDAPSKLKEDNTMSSDDVANDVPF
jgi:hypothetical protein